MSVEHLDFQRHDRITSIGFDRQTRLNAFNLKMLSEIEQVAHEISSSDARAVVLYGKGQAFSGGMDVETFEDGVLFQPDPDLRYDAAALGGQAAAALEALPQVVIAALHGHVVGGAMVMAAACDLRVAEPDTVFSIPEVDIGIPLAWGGIPRLVAELGPALAKDLVMTCRPFPADEAVAAGFINRLVPAGDGFDSAMDLARQIASKPRFAIATTKKHVAEVLSGDTSRDDSLGLLVGIEDAESALAREAYLSRFHSQR